jgi:RNA polymerase sigma-70 factor, ECF subfamily
MPGSVLAGRIRLRLFNAMNDAGMNDEFLELIAACQSRLFGYLYSLLHHMEDTEDVLQQATLAMWRHFGEYDRNRCFFAWARQFAKLSALNHIRSKQRERVVFSEKLISLMEENTPEEGDDLSGAYHDMLARCMDRLPRADRDLLELCYFERCSVTKAAAKLGRSPQSTCNSLRRIRAALFDCITAFISEGKS